MNTINAVTNQTNFMGLVPKAKYKGTPNLSKPKINFVIKLKTLEKQAEKDMTDVENQIYNRTCSGKILQSLYKEMEILEEYKAKIALMIKQYKKDGYTTYTLPEIIKTRAAQMHDLNTELNTIV